MMSEGELKVCFRNIQNEIDKLYKDFGATDEVISIQISLNQLRNKYNIADEKEIINDIFVQ